MNQTETIERRDDAAAPGVTGEDLPIRTSTSTAGVWARYLALMLVGFILASSVWFGLVKLQTGTPTQQTNWVAGAWAKKVARAQSIHGPKLLIASGSSGLFDIRARQIQSALGTPCVNLALHAGLGLDYLLNRFEKVAQPGDIVLLAPEYEMYDASTRPSTVLVDYVFAYDPDYLNSLPAGERAKWMLALPPDRLIEGVRNRLRHRTVVDDPTSVYRASAIDEYGDQIGNLASLQRPSDRFALSRLDPSPTVRRAILAPSALAHIDRFVQWCRSRNVRVLVTYPATVDFADYHTTSARNFFTAIRDHYAVDGVPVLGNATDFLYPTSAFFDTEYHLESRTTSVNTDKLIVMLRPYMTNDGAVKTPSSN
jgi:hypothetical protein